MVSEQARSRPAQAFEFVLYFTEDLKVLILSRREAECICLGDSIVLTIVTVGKDKVRIGIEAPPGVRILRNELEAATIESSIPFPAPGPRIDATPTTPHRRAA